MPRVVRWWQGGYLGEDDCREQDRLGQGTSPAVGEILSSCGRGSYIAELDFILIHKKLFESHLSYQNLPFSNTRLNDF